MSIFRREKLAPAQLRTVAARRFDDANYLRRSGENRYANGAIYLAGFAVECLLKARLLEKYPQLQTARDPARLPPSLRPLWSLAFRHHDLDELLAYLPEIEKNMEKRLAAPQSQRLVRSLRKTCGDWSVHARYSPRTIPMAAAEEFLDRVRELRVWL
ncbi:MAG TPA: hypothetical protein VGM03_06965 [Phycisphaerae bacterium]|jgi:hypothetical protein